MKSNIKTLIVNAIKDNKRQIRSFTPDGNIREYFASDLDIDGRYAWYLTDEEIELYENNEAEAEKLINQINDFLDQYNMPIEQFLGEKVEPAY